MSDRRAAAGGGGGSGERSGDRSGPKRTGGLPVSVAFGVEEQVAYILGKRPVRDLGRGFHQSSVISMSNAAKEVLKRMNRDGILRCKADLGADSRALNTVCTVMHEAWKKAYRYAPSENRTPRNDKMASLPFEELLFNDQTHYALHALVLNSDVWKYLEEKAVARSSAAGGGGGGYHGDHGSHHDRSDNSHHKRARYEEEGEGEDDDE